MMQTLGLDAATTATGGERLNAQKLYNDALDIVKLVSFLFFLFVRLRSKLFFKII